MQVNGPVHTYAVAALHDRESPTADIDALRKRLGELGVRFEATHASADDPALAPHFTVELPDDQELLARILAMLRENPAVAAAYVKPADELP